MILPETIQKELNEYLKFYYDILKKKCINCNGRGYTQEKPDDEGFDYCPYCHGIKEHNKKYIMANIRDQSLFSTSMEEFSTNLDKHCFDKYQKVYNGLALALQHGSLYFCKDGKDKSNIQRYAIHMFKKLIKMNYECFYINYNTLVATIFSFSHKDESIIKEKEILLNFLTNVKFLFIDDFKIIDGGLGQNETNFIVSRVLNFLQMRKVLQHMTIITINATLDEFPQIFQDKITEFLTEFYFKFVIKMNGQIEKKNSTTKKVMKMIKKVQP